jgi:hypothetical protein
LTARHAFRRGDRCLASHPSWHVCHCTRKPHHPGAHVCYCGAGWVVDVPTDLRPVTHVPPHPPLRNEEDLLTKWDPGRSEEDEEARSVEDRRQQDQDDDQDDHLERLAQEKERYQGQHEQRQEEYHEEYLADRPAQLESNRIEQSVLGGQQPGLRENAAEWNEEQAEQRDAVDPVDEFDDALPVCPVDLVQLEHAGSAERRPYWVCPACGRRYIAG